MQTPSPEMGRREIRRELAGMIIPMMLSLLFIGSTQIVDAVFVGRLGTDALAAFGFISPLMGLLFQVQIAFGIGVTSAVARATGAGDKQAAQRLASHSALLGLLFASLVAGAVALTGPTLFEHMGATAHQLELIDDFMGAWLLGTPAVWLVIWGTAAMRGVGDAKASAVGYLLQAAVNWMAVPALVFGVGPIPACGIRGAAIGAVLGYALASLLVMYSVRRRELFAWHAFRAPLTVSLRVVAAVALPAILTYMLAPTTSAIVTSLLAQSGSSAVAAFGVVSRVFDGFLSMVPLAIAAGLGPFVGLSWGAGRREQLREAVEQCRTAALLWGLGCYACAALAAEPLSRLFADDPAVTPAIVTALRVLPLGFAGYGALLITNAAYNGVGRAATASWLAALRTFGLTVPLCLLAAHFADGPWIYAALAVSSTLADRIGAHWLRRDGLRRSVAALVPQPAGESNA